MENSLPAKLKTLKPGESFVLFGDYKKTMRQIGVLIKRNYCSPNMQYKKAHVIVHDVLMIGVLITNNEDK